MEKKKYHRGPRRRKKKSVWDIVINIILVAAILVFLFAAIMLVKSLLPYAEGKSEYKKIQDVVLKQNENFQDDSDEPAAFTVDFAELKRMNKDAVGWIRFDEPSIINYPVVQGTDNVQYLTQSFTADDNKLGTIFVNVDNKGDFSDRETIIYGHNMSYGGDMFTKLSEYEDEAFYSKNPYFYIYTPNGKINTYQVFAAEYVMDTASVYDVNLPDDGSFMERISELQSGSLYQTGTEVNAENKIVVLSTCTNFAQDQRFILCGVKISEE